MNVNEIIALIPLGMMITVFFVCIRKVIKDEY